MRAKYLFIVLVSINAYGQKMRYDNGSKLKIHLLGKEIVISQNVSDVDFEMLVLNNSDTSFILYGFKDLEDGGYFNEIKEWFMSPRLTAEHGVFLLDRNNTFSTLGIMDLVSRESSRGRLPSWDSVTIDVHNKTIIVPARDSLKVRVRIKRKKDLLRRGQYKLFTIYNCGIYITKIIDEKIVRLDEERNHALLYQGYIQSDTLKLTVR